MSKTVLFIHHSGSLGGAPKSLDLLIKGLRLRGYQSQIMVLKEGRGTEFLRQQSPELVVTKFLYPFHGSYVSGYSAKIFVKNMIGLLISFALCPVQLAKFKPDIVHLNTSCLFLFAFWSRLLFPGAKIVCHVREPILPGWRGWPLRYFNKKFVDQFVSIDRASYESVGCSARNTLVYNPAGEKPMAKKHRRSEDRFCLSSFARVVPENGFLQLIEYFKEFCLDRWDSSLILEIYGLSESMTDYEKKVVLASQESHNILVHPFQSDLDRIFEHTDLVVSPFVSPHFSRMVIEAYAYGVPVLVKDLPGQRDVVSGLGSGLLYSDYPSFKKGLQKFIDDSDFYVEAATKAGLLYQDKFTIDAHTRQIDTIYSSLLTR